MESKFQILLILLAVLAGTALLARRVNIAPAILLLLAGIAIAFVPGMPQLALAPDLVLLVVLPPLIYSASVAMSWREFRHNLRPIILLAGGCVVFTAAAVAAATHYLIGLPWNVGFLLGAIVAWVASIFDWPIPWNIQRIYLLICLLIFIICVATLLVGTPMVHFIGRSDTTSSFPCPATSTTCPA